jgi:hypothetical protein
MQAFALFAQPLVLGAQVGDVGFHLGEAALQIFVFAQDFG